MDTKISEIDWSTKYILIVEDEKFNSIYLNAALSRTKINLLWAKNGEEAIEQVKNAKKIDLILMDIRLPVMDGYEATKAIKLINRNIPIIAQTAYALEGDREKILNVGCDDYLSKPILINDLLSTIGKYI